MSGGVCVSTFFYNSKNQVTTSKNHAISTRSKTEEVVPSIERTSLRSPTYCKNSAVIQVHTHGDIALDKSSGTQERRKRT